MTLDRHLYWLKRAIIFEGIVILIWAVLLWASFVTGRCTSLRRRAIDLEMENAALRAANQMLLRSAAITKTPIYVGRIDRRDERGNPIRRK